MSLNLQFLAALSPSRNVTAPDQEVEDASAAVLCNITSPTGYEEFSQGLSKRITEIGTVDEGFDEITSTLAFGETLRARLGSEERGEV